ncbi:MAG: glycogen-debranching protein, partial [Synechococcaceae cyanobacterium]|nr:glycogen-debranching protein [Synechococcaceae cyanobacterium]
NNTWCQDNPLGWMHWQPDAGDLALRTYLQRLLQLRRQLLPLLNPELPFEEQPQRRSTDPSHRWRQWHGVEIDRPDWAAWSHTLAWTINDSREGPLLWCGLNAYGKAIHFDLPVSPAGWLRVIDTALQAGEDLPSQPQRWTPLGIPLESRSLVLLVSRPLLANATL